MARVWNISDYPMKDVVARTVVVLGKTLRPGQSTVIADDLLATAHKLKAEAEAGFVAIGTLPAYYANKKRPPRAAVVSVTSAHKPDVPPENKAAPEAPKKKKKSWATDE